MSEIDQGSCTCCPYGYHIHTDFSSFAEEQLICIANKTKVVPRIQNKNNCYLNSKYSYTSKMKFPYCEQSDPAEEKPSEEASKIVKASKPPKRESVYIQQKILNLKNCAPRTKEEVYGVGLLEAIKEFEDFIGKAWGKLSSANEKLNTDSKIQSNISNVDQAPDANNSILDANEKISDFCMHCQRKCSCKEEEKPVSKVIPTCDSKSVNTEYVEHLSISTNTGSVGVDSFSVSTTMPRSEQLSKLTIRKKNPVTQQPDCGGEGNIPNPRVSDDAKCEIWEEICRLEESAKTTLSATTSEATESKDRPARKVRVPTEDIKAALKLLNGYVLHGKRTGTLAAFHVARTEWFAVVGTKNAYEQNVLNYLNMFKTFSPQLLRYMANVPDESGITALHYAVSYGNYLVVSRLLDTGIIDPDKANKAGYTSIMLASLPDITTAHEEEIIRKLISLGDANIKAAQRGQTALMLAASHGRFKMVKLLLYAGAEVNVQDEDGSTALMCAVEHGHADIVQCLLAQSTCDPNIADNDGLTALNIAMEANHKDIAVLLYAHMHFPASPPSLATTREDLVVSKRSQSIPVTALFESSKVKQFAITKSPIVARKQQSSIN